MTSFFDVFRWNRFISPFAMELLFWLFSALVTLSGAWFLYTGIAMTERDAAPGLILIAMSIIGTLVGVIAARVACEAIVILFRVNENLMDIAEAAETAAEIGARFAGSTIPRRAVTNADIERPSPSVLGPV